jgi:hypothetical protein
MRPVGQMIALSRLLILAWLMTWVATASFYLPDLLDTTDGPPSLQTARQKHFFHLSNHVLNFQDDNAILDDDDAKKRKMGQSSAVDVLCPLPTRPLLLNSVMESRAIHLRPLLFTAPHGSRAPPSISIVSL